MDDATKDRIEGTFDTAKGDAKSTVGKATGDTQTQAEGEGESLLGKVKQGAADLKDKAKEGVSDR
jgi:uncharacterized protein YjbJ (UPF0337 family)